MLWYIFISIRILVQNRRQFNERTAYKYVGNITGTNKEWCRTQGVVNMGASYHCPVNQGGQETITRTWREP